jgi:hypothetical protein
MADMPEIITRREAKENGLKFYFTGKPCIHSHVFIRHTQNGVCVQCVKDNYQKNKEAIKERSRKHHHNMMQNQPDKVLIKGKEICFIKEKDGQEILIMLKK